MSNEILLKTLRDTLRRIERRKEEAEERIQAYQKKQQEKQERWHNAEQRKQQAEERNAEIVKEMDVLRIFMSSQADRSSALREQFDLLQQHHLRIMSEVKSMTDHIYTLRAEYQQVTGQLAEVEQDCSTAQREWDEIAEKVTQISSSQL